MYLLLAIELGQKLAPTPDGRLAIDVPIHTSDGAGGEIIRNESVVIPSLDDGLAALEALGWVEIGDGEATPPTVTWKGKYGLRRWMEGVYGRKGKVVARESVRWVKVDARTGEEVA
jgi:hypothetical protein